MPADPSHIGKYRVERRLGHGGMGVVYLAHDTRIGRHVAIKLLRVADEETRQRFEVEAQSAGRLKHPNIVTVHDYLDYEGDPCLVMEYVEGDTLAAMIDQGRSLPVDRQLDLMEQVCRGLGYAHRAGIVHRDVKPSNLMVDAEGHLKVLDFGIARTTGSGLTQVGHVVGTVAYMSPEQVRGERVDTRSDIFAVGLVLYEFLSGKRAFRGDSDFSVYNKILTGTPDRFTHPDTRLATGMAPVFEKALAKDPAQRYQEIEALGADLARIRRLLSESSGSQTIVVRPMAAEAGEAPVDPHAPTVMTPPSPKPPQRMITPTPARPTPNTTSNEKDPLNLTLQLSTPLRPTLAEEASIRTAALPTPSRTVPSPAASKGALSHRQRLSILAAMTLVILAGAGYLVSTRWRADQPVSERRPDAPPQKVEPPSVPRGGGAETRPVPNENPTTASNPQNKPEVGALTGVPTPAPPSLNQTLLTARLAVAERLFNDGEYDRAILELEAVLRVDKANAAATQAIASVRRAKAAEARVLKNSEDANRGPEISDRLAAAQRLHDEEDYDGAIAAFELALKLSPGDKQAIAGRDRARRAKTAVEAVLKKKPPGPSEVGL